MLKKYTDNQNEKVELIEFQSSGVACDEVKCDGEMMIPLPIKWHTELNKLRRAKCAQCGWLGWV